MRPAVDGHPKRENLVTFGHKMLGKKSFNVPPVGPARKIHDLATDRWESFNVPSENRARKKRDCKMLASSATQKEKRSDHFTSVFFPA
jgi:hypothetical protein